MKLPSYDVGNGQSNIEYSEFTHNRPFDPAYNPGRPSKTPTMYGLGKRKSFESALEFPQLFEQAQERATEKRKEREFDARIRERSRGRAKQSERAA